MTDKELLDLSRKIALALHDIGQGLTIEPADMATATAMACAEIHLNIYGGGGLIHMQSALDVCERQLMNQEGGKR